MDHTISEFDLRIRFQIYRFITDQCKVPSAQELASLLNLTREAVDDSFNNLHIGHMIYLEPGTSAIRMAFPFSAIPTQFKVREGQKNGGLTAPGTLWVSLPHSIGTWR